MKEKVEVTESLNVPFLQCVGCDWGHPRLALLQSGTLEVWLKRNKSHFSLW